MESTSDAVPDARGDEDVPPHRDGDVTADPADEIPFEDLPLSAAQPETQGEDPLSAELGEDGEGDLLPEDLGSGEEASS